ncbi:MAG: hypothetical protein ACRCXZ_03710 [Patescibacteria group bacterium]
MSNKTWATHLSIGGLLTILASTGLTFMAVGKPEEIRHPVNATATAGLVVGIVQIGSGIYFLKKK